MRLDRCQLTVATGVHAVIEGSAVIPLRYVSILWLNSHGFTIIWLLRVQAHLDFLFAVAEDGVTRILLAEGAVSRAHTPSQLE